MKFSENDTNRELLMGTVFEYGDNLRVKNEIQFVWINNLCKLNIMHFCKRFRFCKTIISKRCHILLRILHFRDGAYGVVYGEVWKMVWKEVCDEAYDEAYDGVCDHLQLVGSDENF